MSSNSDFFKEGDKVVLANIAVNRYLCKRLGKELIGKKGIVKDIEIFDDFIEKCVLIDGLLVFMKYFPIWHKSN